MGESFSKRPSYSAVVVVGAPVGEAEASVCDGTVVVAGNEEMSDCLGGGGGVVGDVVVGATMAWEFVTGTGTMVFPCVVIASMSSWSLLDFLDVGCVMRL